jgi:hypothetical protein
MNIGDNAHEQIGRDLIGGDKAIHGSEYNAGGDINIVHVALGATMCQRKRAALSRRAVTDRSTQPVTAVEQRAGGTATVACAPERMSARRLGAVGHERCRAVKTGRAHASQSRSTFNCRSPAAVTRPLTKRLFPRAPPHRDSACVR